MKKKILSLTAVVLAMAMTTTSVFAAIERGSGEMDNVSGLSANDVQMVLNAAKDNQNANVNGDITNPAERVTTNDALVLMRTILQPKTVTESYALRIYTTTPIFEQAVQIGSDADFNGTTKETVNGLIEVTDPITKDMTIEQMIEKAVPLIDDAKAQSIADTLNRIEFYSAGLGRNVALNTPEGWSMFCYAVQPIVPMEESKASLCKKPASTAEEIAARQTQVDALKTVEGKIVTNGAPITLTAADIVTIKDALYVAFPNNIEDQDIKDAAERILNITDAKYDFTVVSANGKFNGQKITANDDFINAIVSLKDYKTTNVAKIQETFGDSITITSELKGSGNPKSFTFEVYEKAALNN